MSRMAARDLPVAVLVGTLSAVVSWIALIDLEAISGDAQPIPQAIVLLVLLLFPVAVLFQFASRRRASGLWTLIAPLMGAYLVAFYFSFDVYGSPPYPRNAAAGDMPAAAIVLGASVAVAAGVLAWFRRGIGVAVTWPVGVGCFVLAFFSNVFH